MLSASMRAYRDGPDTMDERRQLVVDVLNSTPLAGRVGHGEVIGLGEGLALWFGADFNRANALLLNSGDGDANLPDAVSAFSPFLALLFAHLLPSFYLLVLRCSYFLLFVYYFFFSFFFLFSPFFLFFFFFFFF